MKQGRIESLSNDANLPVHTYLYYRAKGMSHMQCKLPQVPTALSPTAVLGSVTHDECILQVGRPGFAKRIANAKYQLMPSKRLRKVKFTCGNPNCINPNHLVFEFTEADKREAKKSASYMSFAALAERYYVSEQFIKDSVLYS